MFGDIVFRGRTIVVDWTCFLERVFLKVFLEKSLQISQYIHQFPLPLTSKLAFLGSVITKSEELVQSIENSSQEDIAEVCEQFGWQLLYSVSVQEILFLPPTHLIWPINTLIKKKKGQIRTLLYTCHQKKMPLWYCIPDHVDSSPETPNGPLSFL